MSNILALDVGEKKIGVAIGEAEAGFAFPRPALLVDDWSAAWPAIEELITTEGVTAIVIGLPLNTDGTVGPQAEKTKVFAAELKQRYRLPVYLVDERLTTQAVQHEHTEPLPRGAEDSFAAQQILETYFQRQ